MGLPTKHTAEPKGIYNHACPHLQPQAWLTGVGQVGAARTPDGRDVNF